jgi:hypothetical protein
LQFASKGSAKDSKEDVAILDRFLVVEGCVFGRFALGWCFDDGNLAGTDLLYEVQSRCQFLAAELLHIQVEPMGNSIFAENNNDYLLWTIRNANAEVVAHGSFSRQELKAIRFPD